MMVGILAMPQIYLKEKKKYSMTWNCGRLEECLRHIGGGEKDRESERARETGTVSDTERKKKGG